MLGRNLDGSMETESFSSFFFFFFCLQSIATEFLGVLDVLGIIGPPPLSYAIQ